MSAARANSHVLDVRIEKENVRTQVVRAIRNAIISGEFLAGSRLVESDLCAALEVSRPSLREALRHLESEHLVHFIPNRGCFVAELGWDDALQIYETRLVIEPEIASRAADRISDKAIMALDQAITDFAIAVEAKDKVGEVSATTDFYQVITGSAGNVIMAGILDGLNARISVLRTRSMSQPERSRQSLIELSAITTAIRARDSLAAREAARSHVENACEAARHAMHRAEA